MPPSYRVQARQIKVASSQNLTGAGLALLAKATHLVC
jgi:hypothetical protein